MAGLWKREVYNREVMNAAAMLEHNAGNGIWILAAVLFGLIAVIWLLDRVEDARQWFVRRVLRRGAASSQEETGTPPLIRSLHRDRRLKGGALARYTSENRAFPIEPEPVRRPRIGSQR